MSRAPVTATLGSVRRLTVTKQHLGGKRPVRATTTSIPALVRELPYVQWDPVSIVAPSHLLSLWSRLSDFRPAQLERLLWKDRSLFLHWTPIASIVATQDYPLYGSLMRGYPDSLSNSWGAQRAAARAFLAGRAELRKKILNELRDGPLQLGEFDDHRRTKRSDGEWSPGSDVSLMLFHLSMSGDVMVVGHRGGQNLWGLRDHFLPGVDGASTMSEEEVDGEAAQRAIRALGTATPTEINYYFVRGRYWNLRSTLARLEAEATIHRVAVKELGPRDERYVHDRDVELLDSVGASAWEPRLSLLPPFDNLLASTARTSRIFGFEYVREQFLPKEKRRFGTYVLPILWGDRLIGRIDPRLDKASRTLEINAVHAEPNAPRDREVAAGLRETIARLGSFLGATNVRYSARVPPAWKSSLG
ncbi:MAG: winged helix DNA-binding domain-containing protein [Thermoplasmata archaeon]|nr:winged helix DNA-binding domain-containing protein [Thermoplasmata archaeon]